MPNIEMNSTWKTIHVLICSTFHDMKAEREHLARFVIPRLRQELIKRCIHLVVIDLQWGVIDDEESLDIYHEISFKYDSRLICFLGGRYVFVPLSKSCSNTANEIFNSALNTSQKKRNFASFYFRDETVTTDMVEIKKGEFHDPIGSDNHKQLSELKQAIVTSGFNPSIYSPQWDNSDRRLIKLKEFGNLIYHDLLASIDTELDTETHKFLSEFAIEKLAMEAFAEQHNIGFVHGSRLSVTEYLLAHILKSEEKTYLCLNGVSGSGKSALLSHLSLEITNQPSILLIHHFIGASPGSTDMRLTIARFCHELKAGSPNIDSEIPYDLEELKVSFSEFLKRACEHKRVVILIDSIDQFDSDLYPINLNWLLNDLPSNSRVILSTTHGIVLEELRKRDSPPSEIGLVRLTKDDGKEIIDKFSQRIHKFLEPSQINVLLNKKEAVSPHYLRIALEELFTLGFYKETTNIINELPETIQGLFNWILKRLENDLGFCDDNGKHVGHILVPQFFSLLSVSRYGLSRHELIDLIDPGDSQGNVAALINLWHPYLMQHGNLINLHYIQLHQAVEELWLNSDTQRQKAHTQLGDYFQNLDNFSKLPGEQFNSKHQLNPTPKYANRRKAEELFNQKFRITDLIQKRSPEHTKASEDLESLLLDLLFLECKVEAGLVFDLLEDFSRALSILPDNSSQFHLIQLIREALKRDVNFIHRHPTTFFQSVWNSCWWYDCPQSGDHYEPPHKANISNSKSSSLSGLLESWRKEKASNEPKFIWLRSHRPPKFSLGNSAIKYTISGHDTSISNLSFSPDGLKLISSAYDGTMKMWNAKNGKLLSILNDSKSRQSDDILVVWLQDKGQIISSSNSGKAMKIWDTNSSMVVAHYKMRGKIYNLRRLNDGNVLMDYGDSETRKLDLIIGVGKSYNIFTTDKDSIAYSSELCLSPDRKKIAVKSYRPNIKIKMEKCSVFILDINDGTIQRELSGHSRSVVSIAWSSDGHMIATGSYDGSIIIWDVSTGNEINKFDAKDLWVTQLIFTSDGQRLISASGNKAIIWDVNTGVELKHLHGHDEGVNSLAFLAKDNMLAVSSGEGKIRIWNTMLESNYSVLISREGEVKCSAFSSDGNLLATGSWQGPRGRLLAEICIWNTKSGLIQQRLKGHEYYLHSVSFSADNSKIVSCSGDSTIRIWDIKTGQQLHCIQFNIPWGYGVEFSKDGKRIICKWGQWNVETGESINDNGNSESTPSIKPMPRYDVYLSDHELKIVDNITEMDVAWFPVPFADGHYWPPISNPSGNTWVGGYNFHFYIVSLDRL